MTQTLNGVDLGFLNKMHTTVLQALLSVDGESEFSRDRRLHALFNDLTCRIDPEVRHHFKNGSPMPQRYYLMMSHYYLEYPEKAEEVLSSALHLWNSLHMPLIFALLFHEYLFIKCANNSEFSIKRMASFVKGANKLFWLDLENSSKRFAYIWMFLFKGVLERPERWQCLIARKYLDVFDLVAKFYFYYHGDKNLESFIKTVQAAFLAQKPNTLDTPLEHRKLSAMNMFCNEVVRTMKLMKNEEVLKHYLTCCRIFSRPELAVTGKKTQLRLGDLISDLATPGYPMYPTSEIKSEARATLNILWPYGALLRETIRFSFRLLRPLSFLHWFQYRGAQLQSLFANVWLWIVGTLVLILSSLPILSRFIPQGKQARQDAIDAAQRSERLVLHLSSQSIGVVEPRRVRFQLPGEEEEENDDESAPSGTASNSPSKHATSPKSRAMRSRSPLRQHAVSRIGSADSSFASSSDEPDVPDPVQDLRHSLQIDDADQATHDIDELEDEDEEDKDDSIDDGDLETYVRYSTGLSQSPPSASVL